MIRDLINRFSGEGKPQPTQRKRLFPDEEYNEEEIIL